MLKRRDTQLREFSRKKADHSLACTSGNMVVVLVILVGVRTMAEGIALGVVTIIPAQRQEQQWE